MDAVRSLIAQALGRGAADNALPLELPLPLPLPMMTLAGGLGVGLIAIVLVSLAFFQLHWGSPFQPRHEKYQRQLSQCRSELLREIKRLNCAPIMLRLAWHDAGTFDKTINQWPLCGGANGSIRFDYEVSHPNNAGLSKAIDILMPFKTKHRLLSWADLIQMAGALAIEATGGPVIAMRYGRKDAPPDKLARNRDQRGPGANEQADAAASASASASASPFSPSPARSTSTSTSTTATTTTTTTTTPSRGSVGSGSGSPSAKSATVSALHDYGSRLPGALPPFSDGAPNAEVHIRNVFYRLGLTNRDIVALIGAHTIGRAYKERSGVCPYSSGDQGSTKYTRPTWIAKPNGEAGIGMAGGMSWTRNWLTFDNSYFRRLFDPELAEDDQLLWLPTDQALYDCPEFRPYFVNYAKNQDLFFQDYAAAHKKLSECGARFEHSFTIEPNAA